jgi:hypothetical protein
VADGLHIFGNDPRRGRERRVFAGRSARRHGLGWQYGAGLDVSVIPKGNLFQIGCAWLPDCGLAGRRQEL